ncbi:MAG: EFR1 family ferrodoxin [bacterium]|nr:EFR1 family ferrodoxin [bacterium]
MILYFSGTGNSLYIAKRLSEALGDRIISIAELTCREQYELTVGKDESIGFVYPVIACAPPDIVTEFIKKVRLIGYKSNYIYSVFNCAGTPEYTSRIMKETAKKKGLTISGFYGVLMPGNYITKKKHLSQDKVEKYLAECDETIDSIVNDVKLQKCNYTKEKHSFLLSYGLHKLAVLEKTEKFIFSDACVRCGKCRNICPMEAITMEQGKPKRDKSKCVFCLACVNVCPTRALQVGNKTQGNPQYINPYYDGKARKEK